MYSVNCTVYSVQCIKSGYSDIFNTQKSRCLNIAINTNYKLYIAHYLYLGNLHCTLYIVQCTLYNLHFIKRSVYCSMSGYSDRLVAGLINNQYNYKCCYTEIQRNQSVYSDNSDSDIIITALIATLSHLLATADTIITGSLVQHS